MSKVRRADIRPELRPAASLLGIGRGAQDEKGFAVRERRSASKRGKWHSRLVSAREEGILREDGSLLRVLVCGAAGGTFPGATGFLWLHGGAFAFGVPEEETAFAELFCRDGDCVMVIPDYTKSLEAPYPAAFEDCYLSLLWMKEHAAELGIDSSQLFVGGTGAGGGLTAALCLAARERGDVKIAFQMPLYPMLDDRMLTESSADNNGPLWTSTGNRAAWDLYLKEVREKGEIIPAYAAPGREKDLTGLPPACSFVGDLDLLRDETVRYCARLKKCGTDVSLRVFSGCYHHFDQTAVGSRIAGASRRFMIENFLYAQENYRAQNSASTAEWNR